jgi:DNA-binding NtrC family response regulator
MATHKNLMQEVKEGRFREDLYYRISVFPLTLPPLRDRIDDLPALIDLFLTMACTRHSVWTGGVSPHALMLLSQSSWPGNIRQLQHELERASILADGCPLIEPEHLNPALTKMDVSTPISYSQLAIDMPNYSKLNEVIHSSELALKSIMSHVEEHIVRNRLEQCGQNRTRCAESLELSRQALQAKLAKWKTQ